MDEQDQRTWSPELAEEFDQLTRHLLTGGTVAEILTQVVATAQALIPEADLVSVTLRDPQGHYTTPVDTGEPAEALDQLQYTHDEGPCLAAGRDGPHIVDVSDLKASPLWPRWSPGALDLGVRSVLAVGLLPAKGPRLGALNFYAFEAGALDVLDDNLAAVLAGHAGIAVAATQAVSRAELEAAHLREALRSRDVIGQAKGILMQRQGITEDEAFGLLRRTSQDLNIKLAKVAQLITSRRREL
ncbi:MAG TPA: GAF and ANTAR domain-containing protein [Amycolatopsis sp.]|nr:GAF and ANTAR domain-containing protein [Amycolatopsis sp.]